MHKINAFLSLLIAAFFAVPIRPAFASAEDAAGIRFLSAFRVAVVVPEMPPADAAEQNDLGSFRTSLTVAGIRFTELQQTKIAGNTLRGYDCLVVPHSSAVLLNAAQTGALLQAVEDGCGLVLDGESLLANALGIRLSSAAVSVREVKDLQFPSIPLYWKPVPVKTIVSGTCQPLCIERSSGASVAVRLPYLQRYEKCLHL